MVGRVQTDSEWVKGNGTGIRRHIVAPPPLGVGFAIWEHVAESNASCKLWRYEIGNKLVVRKPVSAHNPVSRGAST